MDPLSIFSHLRNICDKIREKPEPILIEAKTYRYRGHSMSDPGKYRTREEIQETRENRDPIERIRALLISKKYLTEEHIKDLDKKVREEVAKAAELSQRKECLLKVQNLYEDVYKDLRK